MAEQNEERSEQPTSGARTRASVTAAPAYPAADRGVARPEGREALSPTSSAYQPAEAEHTPVLPQGFVSNWAEGANNIPAQTPVVVVEPEQVTAAKAMEQALPAVTALVSPARTSMEIASPAPLPRPGDENLTRGTEADAELRSELEGSEPEMPLDPNSAEARKRADENRELDEKNQSEAAKNLAERQEKMRQRYEEQADKLAERQEEQRRRLEERSSRHQPRPEQLPS